MNMSPAVDTFLFTSGLLLVWSFLTAMREKKQYDVIVEPLRLALTWAIFLLAAMLLRSHLLRTEDSNESICFSSWWHHILFISNFLNPDYSVILISVNFPLFTFPAVFTSIMVSELGNAADCFLPRFLVPILLDEKFALGDFSIFADYFYRCTVFSFIWLGFFQSLSQLRVRS